MATQQTTATLDPAAAWSDLDRRMMRRALDLALQGVGQVSPGPLVGCVIVSPDGEIVGEGLYLYEQLKHAETYALEQAGPRARGATAYVSLEPHAHQGRTPPCTDALINAGVVRVVAPHEDPNPKVSGRGFAHLRAAGIDVSVGLLEPEAAVANEKYFHFMRTGRPFVHLKLGTSLDGKIATRTGHSRWITSAESRERAHELRHEYDAILVGAGTVSIDDPLLTDRSGKRRGKALVRVVLDESLKISKDSQLAKTASEAPVLIFSGSSTHNQLPEDIELVPTAGRDPLAVLNELGKRSIQSVLIEGGSTVAGQFLDARLVNKISFFIAPKIIGGRDAIASVGGQGVELMTDAVQLENVAVVQRGVDIEVTGYPRYQGEG
jgi:diaminohydroxyphosphoribosylaminopyrimidine deaminase/5-amino-6-(5-phosphoribosylamino)uracil reductase